MTDIGLGFRREEGESWRDAVKRISSKYQMDIECLEAYDDYIASGESEETSAWDALYEWDCLDLYVNGEPKNER